MVHFQHVHRGEDISVKLVSGNACPDPKSGARGEAAAIPIHVCRMCPSVFGSKLVSNAEICECARVLRASNANQQQNRSYFISEKSGRHSPSFVRLTNFCMDILPQAESTIVPAICAMRNGNHRNGI